MILLDTHVLLWLDRDDPNLGPEARAAIERAWAEGAAAVSAISFWEAAMLDQRGRIALKRPADTWRNEWLSAGLQELAVDGAIAVLGAGLEHVHADPADRFIAATALHHAACLLTADQAILSWAGPLQRLPARS